MLSALDISAFSYLFLLINFAKYCILFPVNNIDGRNYIKKSKAVRLTALCLAVVLCPAVAYGGLYAAMYVSGFLQISKNIQHQNGHLEYIENEYYTQSYTPCDEQQFAAFDIEKAMEQGVKINEIAVIGTHNSYQLLATPQKRALEYALEFDEALKAVLGDKLLMPEGAMGKYDSLEQMRKNDSWPSLKEAAGKIIVLLHPCDVTQQYIDTDASLSSQAMFPMLRFEDIDKSYASFILGNEPETATENNKKTVDEQNLMVRSRADNYPDFSDEKYAFSDNCGSHIITTDYPPRSMRAGEHTYTFGGYTVKLLK